VNDHRDVAGETGVDYLMQAQSDDATSCGFHSPVGIRSPQERVEGVD
jgi:hypothetical protein